MSSIIQIAAPIRYTGVMSERVQFICPACSEVLRIPRQYVGKRGKCNKCGARIALIGDVQGDQVPTATLVTDTVEDPKPEPVTTRQAVFLRELGVKEEEIATLNKTTASERIEALKRVHGEFEEPTEKQLKYLRDAGMSDEDMENIASKAEASRLIETWEPAPTENQLAYLKRLGASDAQLADLSKRSEASDLIEALLKG